MKTMIFDTKGTPAEVMADLAEAIAIEKSEQEEMVEDNFMDFTGATPGVDR